MNWWFILLVFVSSIISFFIGWFAGRKYQKIYDKYITFKKLKENKDE